MTITPQEILDILDRDLSLLYDSQPPTPLREALDQAVREEVAALRQGGPVGRYLRWAAEVLRLLDAPEGRTDHGAPNGVPGGVPGGVPDDTDGAAAVREALAVFRAAQALLADAEEALRRLAGGRSLSRTSGTGRSMPRGTCLR